jgi:predicted Rossmann fold flavoprotein
VKAIKPSFDVIIIGAGAAGMMCAAEAGRRGRSVLIVDHGRAAGEKIRISGGGRCNFTNVHAKPENYISENPDFCRSALRRYTPADFIRLVEAHGIAYHEKALGQLFCDQSARAIVDMLHAEMRTCGVELQLSTAVQSISRKPDGFTVELTQEELTCNSLVIATGGKSIPKMGATGFGYVVAKQFGLRVTETRAGLVPLTLDPRLLESFGLLSGVAIPAEASCRRTRFSDAMLFTHRGLSGPAILQISSFWREGDDLELAMLPGFSVFQELRQVRAKSGRQSLETALSAFLPRRLARHISEPFAPRGNVGDMSDETLRTVERAVNNWQVRPSGSEGYRTAEVTVGGVDTRELESKTMVSKKVPGLFFVGEVVDVTGWLGGYNFQWAWASGWCAGQAV